ncbi:LOG family protein ORF6 in fasciation locus [Roseivivax jejudonensis]|uniref:Cytokinin riboside 5'-monophosphate phosphoribohydrolase n=1 Tax=Roseivivax jejudonensis TaxID=1529041 RepID=A0A1X6YP70_9RHOB|nr:TIGR00730 family Rossman fold protein [Roseivivax jejudonensis]SLN26588.1 LOG family protein ORF6 in fasciation locus [Roseivivax jejudonensis]
MTDLSVCVYCGARAGTDPAWMATAEATGRAIGDNGWRLVYGAGDVGLMGAVARAAQSAGADTFGVIPQHLLAMEVGKRDLARFVVTETMHERKKVMLMNADAIVVLPGGAGSLDEFFEALTWRQLGLHAKPIFLLDVNGFWAPLQALLEHVVDTGFASRGLVDSVQSCTSVEDLTAALRRVASADSRAPE